MKTLIDTKYFESLRDCFKEKNIVLIREKLLLIQDVFSKTDFLLGKLRYHPLGFIYYKMYEFSNNETFRIHIWNGHSKIQEPTMDIHNHFYDVNSFVLNGILYNDLYEVIKDNESTHSIYSGSYVNETTRILTKTAFDKNIRFLGRQIISKDNLYSIKKSEIHSGGNINDEISITIVFSENPGNPEPLVFGPLNGNEKYIYESNMVDKDITEMVKKQIAIT
jgi:hypothetical protein